MCQQTVSADRGEIQVVLVHLQLVFLLPFLEVENRAIQADDAVSREKRILLQSEQDHLNRLVTYLHMQKHVRVKERPMMMESMPRRETVSSEISTVPTE